MIQPDNTLFRLAACWLTVLYSCCQLQTAIMAQSAPLLPQNPDASRLSTLVHLRLGKTTLRQAAATLSTQTGLNIEPAPYLNDRVLTVQMEGITAQQALDALTELNDWSWRRIGQAHYQITRSTPLNAQTPVEVGYAFPATMPKDVRAFLGIDILPAARLPVSGPAMRLIRRSSAPQDNVSRYVRYNLLRWISDNALALSTDLKTRFKKTDEVPMSLLTQTQREQLVWLMLLNVMQKADHYALTGRFASYLEHPDDCVVEVDHDNTLMIMLHQRSPRRVSSSGFSISVVPTPGLPETPLERLRQQLRQAARQVGE